MEISKSSFSQIIKRKEILLYLVLLIAGTSILGWLFGDIILASVSMKYILIAPSTALLFFILSILFAVNYNFEKSQITHSITTTILVLAALFCILVLTDYIFTFNWDIEKIFIPNPEKFGNVSIGRMSPITSVLFFFTCISILTGRQYNSNTIRYVGGAFSLLTFFIANVLVIGYLYKAPLLYGSYIIPVALPTAICFLFFSVTLLRISEYKYWTFNLIKSNPTEIQLLNTFLPLVIFVVVFQGFIETNFSMHQKNPALISAIVILIIVVFTIFIVIRASAILGGKLRRAENALRESESRAKAMYQAIPDMMFRLNRQGVFLDFKAESEDLYNQSNQNITGNHIRNIFPSEFADMIDLQISRSLDTKTLQTFEYQLPMPGLGMRDYEARMIVCGADEVTAMVRDITDRKHNEQALIKTNAYLENLINYANAPIIVWDPNFHITRFNHAFESMTGLTESEVLGQSLDILFPPENAEYSMELIQKTLTGERFETVEIKIRHLDHSTRTVLWNSATLFEPDRKTPVATIAQGNDITERKLAEEEIKLKNEELIRLNAEKDKFFSIIAHDLRGPFSSFLGLTQIMAKELPSLTMGEIQGIAMSMENSATNLFSLLENLLEWARIQRGLIDFSPEIVELHQIGGECIDLIMESAKKKDIGLTHLIPADLKVFADRNMLQTAIRNLVSNAMKFTPQGGKVILSALATDDNNVEISIRDTGIGMNKDMLEKLFRLDEHTRRIGTDGEPSTGLGLLLCKEFIEKNGGRIWAESEVDKGSTFYFTIPGK